MRKKHIALSVIIVSIAVIGVFRMHQLEKELSEVKTRYKLQARSHIDMIAMNDISQKNEGQLKDIILKREAELLEKENMIQTLNSELENVKFVEKSQSEFWMEYENAFGSTKSVQELFDLYRDGLDGAMSEGYGATLYVYYKEIGASNFIKELANLPQYYNISGIVESLSSEMYLYYANSGDINMASHQSDLKHLLDNSESLREKHIIYQLLANIEDIQEKQR